MRETQLSRRQIQMVVLVVVILFAGFMSYVFVILPSTADPVGSRRIAVVAGVLSILAAIWLAKLIADAVRDRRRGIHHGPAKHSGWFDIIFGAIVTISGITCSAITYWSVIASGGGMWTLYYGMIAWGLVQMIIGYLKLCNVRVEKE